MYDGPTIVQAVEFAKQGILLDVVAGRTAEHVLSLSEARHPGDYIERLTHTSGDFNMPAIAFAESVERTVNKWILAGGVQKELNARDEHGHFYFE
jgi:hypothetical protein